MYPLLPLLFPCPLELHLLPHQHHGSLSNNLFLLTTDQLEGEEGQEEPDQEGMSPSSGSIVVLVVPSQLKNA